VTVCPGPASRGSPTATPVAAPIAAPPPRRRRAAAAPPFRAAPPRRRHRWHWRCHQRRVTLFFPSTRFLFRRRYARLAPPAPAPVEVRPAGASPPPSFPHSAVASTLCRAAPRTATPGFPHPASAAAALPPPAPPLPPPLLDCCGLRLRVAVPLGGWRSGASLSL